MKDDFSSIRGVSIKLLRKDVDERDEARLHYQGILLSL